jgi:hypothetical protein
MRQFVCCGLLAFSVMLGVVDSCMAQTDDPPNNRILQAVENEERYNLELDQALATLKEHGVKPGEYLTGQAANDRYEDCMIVAVQEVVEVAVVLGRDDLLRQYRPLYGWMLENDLDLCEGGNYYFSQADEAYTQYAAVGWTVAARRSALKYANWLLESYCDGGTYGDRYSDDDKWIGSGPWPFPFKEVIDWYKLAGWNQAQLDSLERSVVSTTAADSTR